MKTYRSRRGPFTEQPYYTDGEIERTCSEELRGVGLYPTVPEPVRIDRFVEKRFRVTVEYDDLGPGILGYTQFGKSGVKAIVVSRTLDDEGTVVAERRIRSTVAHEAGHGLFHAHLFVLSGQCALFPEGTSSRPRVLCRDDHSQYGRKYNGAWWEFQANRAIGALLMPKPLVKEALSEFLVPVGQLGLTQLPRDRRENAVHRLADLFNVNPTVARLRIDQVLPAGSESGLSL